MQLTFSPEISADGQRRILESRLWNNWLKNASREFIINSAHFSSVDFKKSPSKSPSASHVNSNFKDGEEKCKNGDPLFIKLKAEATDKEGKPVHGVAVLRGDAVGVLVVLECENEKFLLMVEQPRFPLGERHFLEIPAGILDWSSDPLKIAIAELKEEAQMEAQEEELKLLTPEPIAASCGLLDERIYLYSITRKVSRKELIAMDNRTQKYTDEQEWIETKIIPFANAANFITDGKSLAALFLHMSSNS